MESLVGTVRWWLGKLVPGLLLAGIGLTSVALWLGWRDHGEFQARHVEQLKIIGAERGQVLRGLEEIQARLKQIQVEIPTEEERVRKTDKIVAELGHLASTWDRYVGNPGQQQANAEQLARMTTLRDAAAKRVELLQTESKRIGWERDGLEITRASLDARLQALGNDSSAAYHYLGLAWHRLRTGIICALALYGLGCFFFYLRLRKH